MLLLAAFLLAIPARSAPDVPAPGVGVLKEARSASATESGERGLYEGGRLAGGEPVAAPEGSSLAAPSASVRDKYIFVAQAVPGEAAPPSPAASPAPPPPPAPSAAPAAPESETLSLPEGMARGAKWGVNAGADVFHAFVGVALPFLVFPVVGWFLGAIIIAIGAAAALATGLVLGIFGGLGGMFFRKKKKT